MPKEMLAIIDKPIIQYAVEEAKAAGIEEFIFVTGRGKSALEDFFDYSYELNAVLMHRGKKEDLEIVNQVVLDPGQVIYTRQQEPLGLGHAVWCARHMIQDEPFAVLLADDLILSKKSCLQQMMEVYEKKQGNIVAVMEVSKEETSQYGIIDPESQVGNVFKIKGVIEKPDPRKAPSQWAVIGRYILQSDIFHELENLKTGAGGEVQLTDAMSKLLKRSDFYGVNFEGRRFDCGTKQGLLAANMASALERPDMRDGALKAMKKLIEEA
jgi:UTP--glucose-1-phosphate uridylyltransferase